MTSIAILPKTQSGFNMPSLVLSKRSKKSTATSTSNQLTEWLETSLLLFPVQSFSLPAGKILGSDQFHVKFRLREEYQHNFIMLRGLLEFSRPKEMVITAKSTDQTFEMWLSIKQVPDVIHYLNTIIARLLSEIKFKSSLKLVLKYEEKARREQEKLYKAILLSLV